MLSNILKYIDIFIVSEPQKLTRRHMGQETSKKRLTEEKLDGPETGIRR